MPEIRFQHVVSVSSEDKLHKAENLLKPGGTGKWKCAKPGEAMVAVIFQLDRETAIDAIHVGNECSAFVEVLVGKAAASSDKDFQVLLISSAFMSPLESRNNTNTNGVRIFKSNALMKPAATQKWDRIKVVCTQPFNKTITYGLSFIKLLSPEGGEATPEQSKKFGAFTLKKDYSDDSPTPMSRFLAAAPRSPDAAESAASTRLPKAAATASLAAATSTSGRGTVPAAAAPTSADKRSSKEALPRPTPAAALERSSTKPKPLVPSSVPTSANPPSERGADEDGGSAGRKKKAKLTDSAAGGLGTSGGGSSSSASASKAALGAEAGPFNRLLADVVFVLSGFQNPLRSDLRDMALQMGAKYRPDWDPGCTHLICAFPNTPKYNEVVSRGGNIVSKNWILESHKQRLALPWKSYSMLPSSSSAEGKAKSDDPERSSAVDATVPTGKAKKHTSYVKTASSISPKGGAEKRVSKDDDDDVDYGGSTEVESDDEGMLSVATTKGILTASPRIEIDTDDEIESARNQKKPVPKSEEPVKDVGCSSADVPALPDYFIGMNFFLYGNLPSSERLERYIVAYGGEVDQYMTARVSHVVTSAAWDSNFDDAKHANPKIIFVKPEWIVEVHNRQKLLPCKLYLVENTHL